MFYRNMFEYLESKQNPNDIYFRYKQQKESFRERIEAQAAGLPCFISDKINQEVKVTETVTFLPIDRGTKIWVNKIIKSDLSRKDTRMDIKKSGYDVNKSAYEMQQLYFELLRKYV